MNYCQCKLRKGDQEQTAWLPDEFAVRNKIVKLKTDTGWDDGWQVVDAGTFAMEEKSVVDRSRDFTKQRMASDI